MKKIIIPAAAAMIFCGCSKYEPMKQLPPEEITTGTSSTYTGTTVDFIYISTRAVPPRPTNDLEMPEMPDFPDFDQRENPFGENFAELFSREMIYEDFPEMTTDTSERIDFPAADTETAETTVPETSRFSAEITSVPTSPLPEETGATITVSGAFPEYDRVSADEAAGITVTVTTPSTTPADSGDLTGTFPFFETFDIDDYMPDAGEYPEFPDVDAGRFFD